MVSYGQFRFVTFALSKAVLRVCLRNAEVYFNLSVQLYRCAIAGVSWSSNTGIRNATLISDIFC